MMKAADKSALPEGSVITIVGKSVLLKCSITKLELELKLTIAKSRKKQS